MDDDFPRRREPDDTVIPVVMLQVEERLKETRHTLRNEIAVVAAHVTALGAQSSKEHAEVRADVRELRRDISDLAPITTDLRELKQEVVALHETGLVTAAHDETLAAMRKMLLTGLGLLVAFIGAMTGVLALLMR